MDRVVELYQSLSSLSIVGSIVTVYDKCPIASYTSFIRNRCECFKITLKDGETSIIIHPSNELNSEFVGLLLDHAYSKEEYLSFINELMDIERRKNVLHQACSYDNNKIDDNFTEIITTMVRRIVRNGRVPHANDVDQCIRCMNIPLLRVFYEENISRKYIISECRRLGEKKLLWYKDLIVFADEMESFPDTKGAIIEDLQ